MKTCLLLLIVGIFALASVPASFAAVELPAGFNHEIVVGDLQEPTSLAFVPDGRLLLTEQRTGRVRMVVNGHIAATDPVLQLNDVNTTGYERGLLGISVDPLWPAEPFVYLHYTRTGGTVRIVRYRAVGEVSDPLGENLVLVQPLVLLDDAPDLNSTHNGGCLRFGEGRRLFASVGDDADQCGAADSTKLKGKILRLSVDGLPAGPGSVTRAAITPPDNPLSTPDSNARLVWAYGMRNPWRFHIDPLTQLMYVVDVGDATYEEINEAVPGDALGWPWREGSLLRPRSVCPEPGGEGTGGFQEPMVSISHSGPFTAILSAGIYRVSGMASSNWPSEYEGDVFYADYYSGWLRRLRRVGNAWVAADPVAGQPSTTDWGRGLVSAVDFALGPDGSLWWLRQFDDSMYGPTGSLQRIRYIGMVASADSPAAGEATLKAAPGPFSSRARLSFTLPASGYTRLEIYDLSGRLVRRLVEGTLTAGRHEFQWDGSDTRGVGTPPGVYLARLERPGRVEGTRLVRVQ